MTGENGVSFSRQGFWKDLDLEHQITSKSIGKKEQDVFIEMEFPGVLLTVLQKLKIRLIER